MLRRLSLVVLLAALAPGLALAQVPGKLGYQGRLLKADGTPASGVVKLTFRLFDKETQGAELWSETQQVGLTDGFYATFLGTVTPLPESVLDGTERFLQVDVEGEALLPRQRVGSVAYAVRASVAQSVSGGKVDASSLTVAGKTVIDSSGNLDSSISGAFAPKAHTHDAADVASGTLALGRIPQGPGSKLDADTLDGVDSKDLTKKADLSASGTINDASNPVDWTKLKNVPPSLAGVTGLSSVSHDGTLSGDGTSGNPLQVSIGTTAGTVAAGDHTHSQYALDSSLAALKQALGAQGTVNDNGNPVSWTQVKDIPAGIADGIDDTGLSSISVAQPLSGDGTSSGPITMSQASAASSGFLSSSDWATFNSRLASVAVSSPLVGDGTSASPLSLTKASGSTDGYLSAADYAAFNGKLGTVSASAPLSGSGTSSSPLALSKSSSSADGYLSSADFSSFDSRLAAVSTSAPLSGAGTPSSPVTLARSSGTADGYLAAADFSAFSNKLGAVSASAPLAGAGTSASPLTIGKASTTANGYLSSADFATFNSKLGSVSASSPLSGNGTSSSPLAIPKASGTADGYLAAADFSAFNSKLGSVSASGPLSGNGTSSSPLAIPKASGTADGYLAAADFSAFNSKLGSVSASGPISGNGTSSSPLAIPKSSGTADGYLAAADFSSFNSKLGSVSASGPLSGNGTSSSPLAIPKASGTADGYLAAADFSSFNSKLGSVSASGPLSGNGTSSSPLAIPKASGTADGYLAAADFSSFNSKLGSVSASGPLSGNGTSSFPLAIAKASGTADGYLAAADFSSFNSKLGSVSASGPLSGNGTSSSPLAIPKASGTADGYLAAADFSSFNSKLGSVSASGPLSGNGTSSSPLAIPKASGTADGYLAAADFSSFNSKLSAISASAPLSGSGTSSSPLTIAAASGTSAGYLSAADWSAFNAKVGSVSAGTGITIGGTATAPTVGVVYGTTANTAAAGNDPRLSDARTPTAGSTNYIQNNASTTAQSAAFNVSGNGVVGGTLGIGSTSTAEGRFVISHTGGSSGPRHVALVRPTVNNEAGMTWYTGSTWDWWMGTDDNGTSDFYFWSPSAGYVMSMQKSTGRVGIGTASPAATLDVAGTVKAQALQTSTYFTRLNANLGLGSSNNHATVLSLSVPVTQTTNAVITYNFSGSCGASSNHVVTRVLVDGSVAPGSATITNQSGAYFSLQATSFVNLGPGTHSIALQYRTPATDCTAYATSTDWSDPSLSVMVLGN